MDRVRVQLTNRFAEFAEPYPKKDLLPYFSFYPPGYRFMPRFRMGQWNGQITLLRRHKVPTGLFLANQRKIEEDLELKFDVRKEFVPIEFKSDGVTSDRAYQNECVECMIAAAKHKGGGLVLAATGVGKTRTAGQFFSRLVGNGCFIVDELTLLKQAKKELSEVMGEEVGEVGDSKFLPKRITVATSQTLHLHSYDERFEPWTESLLVNIIDEIHVAMNRRNFDIVEAIAPPAVFGLTATLELQKKHIRTKAYALTGPVCFEYPIARATEEGDLTKGVVLQVEMSVNSDTEYGPQQSAQEYSDLIVHNRKRNRLIQALVKAAVDREKFPIVLVERIKHLNILSGLLDDIPHAIACGKKTAEERIAAKQGFEKRQIKVLLANKVFQKGVDIKKLDLIIDAGAMKGKNRAIQIFGRGIRQSEGKTGLLHFDIADCGVERFEKAAKSRRLAFKKRGIPVQKVRWDGDVEVLFKIAEKMLEKEVKGVGK